MASRDKTEQIRQHVIEATDDLLYHKGFNLMSFTDIAEASNIPRGNLYYYFKTKEDVLAAVIEHRLQQMRLLLKEWNQSIPTPLERLKRYSSIAVIEQENVIRFGCPMGSLNTELGKSQQPLKLLARKQFDLFKSWLKEQFHEMLPEADSESLALHLLVLTQGMALMAQIYTDPEIIEQEKNNIENWLESLA